jgi:two-component system, chemotaxis family, CheB/CheR fusion protein
MSPSRRTCPVVGLGASAGGLEAFRQFLSAVPEQSGLSYVLVQHLDPNHESLLPELLARCTALPVRQAQDKMPIEADHVYLVPPNANLEIADSHIRLTPFAEPRGLRRPIDTFFKSLAGDQSENAAGIVLSGTGSDGTAGLRAVKEAGGLTLAQSPNTAGYDGMPSSAISTGHVDHILPPARMPGVLIDYFTGSPRFAGTADAELDEHIRRVCEIVNDRLGHDFRNYKRNTLFRRIQRRMQVVGAASPEDYVNRLLASQTECEHLFRDILINVTGFFRDPAAFARLAEIVVPAILEGRSRSDPVRIWVPGCSSGEEAFSLAMLFANALEERPDRPEIQIFATDIDEQMLAIARSGRYPESIAKEVPPHLLAKYAGTEEGRYLLAPAIRDMVRFSPHSVIKDPPFSRIDLISCRNLMIYFDSEVQDRLIALFHYALVPHGFLFLGPSENIHQRADLFEPVDLQARLFKRRRASATLPMELTASLTGWTGRDRRPAEAPAGRGNRFAEPGLRRVFERYAPAHVVVDQRGEIRFSSGRLAKYLDFAAGEPTMRLMELARPDLRRPLREGLHMAAESGRRCVREGLQVRSETGSQAIDLVVDPLEDGATLVVFRDAEEFRRETAEDAAAASHDLAEPEARLALVEDELARTREQLRATIEELETSNEELKSSNEEMMSMNEELQSTNEELTTANDELKTKIDELALANSDLQNFIESTSVATILLDRHLRLRSFTPLATELFRLIDKDRGRPLLDVTARFDTASLEEELWAVLRTIRPMEREINAENGRSYILKVVPYRTVNDLIDGLVLTFGDVTSVKQAQQALAAAHQRYEAATRASGHLVFDWHVDADRTLITGEALALTGRSGEALSGPLEAWLSIIHPDDRDRVGAFLSQAIGDGEPLRLSNRDVKRPFDSEGRRRCGA